jgi:hypothetical protein
MYPRKCVASVPFLCFIELFCKAVVFITLRKRISYALMHATGYGLIHLSLSSAIVRHSTESCNLLFTLIAILFYDTFMREITIYHTTVARFT